jgi:hypothetical protein
VREYYGVFLKTKKGCEKMKVCIIQPPYSTDYSKSDEFFEYELDMLKNVMLLWILLLCRKRATFPALLNKRRTGYKYKKYNCCSHQRSDTHEALKIMSQFLAYNTNAYVIHSSVSMDENSDIGGASMVIAPIGATTC